MEKRILDYNEAFGDNLKIEITRNRLADGSCTYDIAVTWQDEDGPHQRNEHFDSLKTLFYHIHDNFD